MSDRTLQVRIDLDRLSHESADEIRARQDVRLAEVVRFHFNNERNPAYRTQLNAHGINHESELPQTVAEIGRLPLMTRKLLEDGDYARRPCVPFEDVRKIIETTGTSGNPLRVPHTFETMRRCYGEFIARSAVLGGMNLEDPSDGILHWIPVGKDTIEGGMIRSPIVELYPMGALSRGRLKVPIYLDERHLSSKSPGPLLDPPRMGLMAHRVG